MSNFPQGSPSKNSYAQQPAGITDESNKEERRDSSNHKKPSKNTSYEEFVAAEEERQRLILSEDMDSNGFPNSWPKVSPPPFLPVTVAPPTLEPPSPEKDFSPPTVTRNIESPPLPLPPPPRPSKCCIIL
ncbi:hypothetical protein Gotri_004784 [Gossypium trilobum]|uniref:Uncharacterized protein n=1 Tax=Gossypium trilobum TaxID=34281 RepID=A0A7J9F5Y5_9ROSI|nr:hypothetical protein [Gossypium trilobum]